MLCVTQENLVKLLTAECQLERFLLENPPNEKNVDKAAVELPSMQQELLKVAATHPKVYCAHLCQGHTRNILVTETKTKAYEKLKLYNKKRNILLEN